MIIYLFYLLFISCYIKIPFPTLVNTQISQNCIHSCLFSRDFLMSKDYYCFVIGVAMLSQRCSISTDQMAVECFLAAFYLSEDKGILFILIPPRHTFPYPC